MMPMTRGGFDPSTPLGTFIEGGYFLGTIVDPDDGVGGLEYALIVAPFASGYSSSEQWKTTETPDAGADSATNGFANSEDINDSAHPAAFFCRGLSINGFTDWYLPALDESGVLTTNRDSMPVGETFPSGNYWTSTEGPDNFGGYFRQFFGIGASSVGAKTNALHTRAIRRVLIG